MRKSQSSQRLTQGGQSQGTPRSQPPPLASRELQELARAAVRYLLMNDYDKVPIKHTAIVNNVMSKAQNKNTAQVMQLAGKMLKDVYGIELIDDSKKNYLLINNMGHQKHISLPESCQIEQAFLAIVLSIIFMLTNGTPTATKVGLEEGKLFSFLESLDIDPVGHHEYFGDVKKMLETLKSQRYIDVIRIPNTDPPKYNYHWGIRAVHEVSPREALTFASEMYNRENIQSWAAHYKAVEEFEKKG